MLGEIEFFCIFAAKETIYFLIDYVDGFQI